MARKVRAAAPAAVPAGRLFLFRPANPEQAKAADVLRACDVVFLTGEQGTGKTHLALGVAAELVEHAKVKRIVVVRPMVPAGERIGFLPGDLAAKIDPWVEGFKDCLGSMTFEKPDAFFARCVDTVALAYLRGRTLADRVTILDEAQNCTAKQIKMAIGRLGKGGKLFVVGDAEQCDTDAPSVLDEVAGCLDGVKVESADGVHRIAWVRLTRQCRHPLVREATRRLRHLA